MQDRLDSVEQILDWRSKQLSLSAFHYGRIPLSQCRAWRLADGRIEHSTRRFFSVAGIAAASASPAVNTQSQPIIDQPEVGTLAFLLRHLDGQCDVLVQAKTEPGNVGAAQLAPTVQATLSNYNRLHGGAPTRYLEYFDITTDTTSDQLQSEQGTRFLAKYNRNATREIVGSGPEPAGEAWRWCGMEPLLALLHHDYVINTDARSVLVASPWESLGPDGSPFSFARGACNFGADLFTSHGTQDDKAVHNFVDLLDRLSAARLSASIVLCPVPIDSISGWIFEDSEIADEGRSRFRVGYHRIQALDREVPRWDQPLLSDFHAVNVVLVCQRRGGVLHFLLRHAVEIGFREGVQFGPSLQLTATEHLRDPFQRPLVDLIEEGIVHADVWASDEGGRFDHNRVRYRIVQLPDGLECSDGPAASWATLSQIRKLLKISGALTNEARSVLSLLLPYLWKA
ncbi:MULTISPECIES: NDP-hexose 2,3-dehydratase family protein [unclassified Mesorhizobium]|uniref:NDP-hexose 2,3-dehydratase family protein n=1 Tax=unclassified Mesorhizobium TaxID=325217 RepID=UPI00333C484A